MLYSGLFSLSSLFHNRYYCTSCMYIKGLDIFKMVHGSLVKHSDKMANNVYVFCHLGVLILVRTLLKSINWKDNTLLQ